MSKRSSSHSRMSQSRSVLVECPCCQSRIPDTLINSHLDSGCPALHGEKPVAAVLGKRKAAAPVTTFGDVEAQNSDEKAPSGSSSAAPTPTKKKPRAATTCNRPLADLLRPSTFEDIHGHEDLIGPTGKITTVLQGHRTADGVPCLPSMIFWGPAGCGKTTLAYAISKRIREMYRGSKFVALSAVQIGVAELKRVLADAVSVRKSQLVDPSPFVLFLDEIHRFNKLQQDALLPYVEDGTVTLLGATTENPSFEVNNALLSRCNVYVLGRLADEQLSALVDASLRRLSERPELLCQTVYGHDVCGIQCTDVAKEALISLADGDCRQLLSGLDSSIRSAVRKIGAHDDDSRRSQRCDGVVVVDVVDVRAVVQRTALKYDKKGDEHYNLISALHKSMRGSDVNASIYWLSRMIEAGEQPLYICRRLIRFASEDIGLADPTALTQALGAYQASHYIGLPECAVCIAQAVAYLATAPKSNLVYRSYAAAEAFVRSSEERRSDPVPLHICNAPTSLMQSLGYGDGYKYVHDYERAEDAQQEYLPDSVKHMKFWNEAS